MTVQELIDFLEKQPRDIQVLYNFQSDFAVLDVEDITLQTTGTGDIYLRDDRYGRVYHWSEKEGPVFRPTVLIFPGN